METQKRKKVISCGAYVWRKKDEIVQVLLIKPNLGIEFWGLPKGHIDQGETFEQCAMREVFEETGISIELVSYHGFALTNNAREEKTVHIFIAKPCESALEPSISDTNDEVVDVKWFNVNELPKLHYYQQNIVNEITKKLLNELTT